MQKNIPLVQSFQQALGLDMLPVKTLERNISKASYIIYNHTKQIYTISLFIILRQPLVCFENIPIEGASPSDRY